MPDKPRFSHSSRYFDEIEYIYDLRNRDKFRSMKVKMHQESPETLVFTADSEESLERAAEELEQIRERFYKPITKKVLVTKDEVSYFRGKDSAHSKLVTKDTRVEKVYFNNIVDKNDVEMVQIVVYGSRPSVDKFMSEVLRSISSLTQKKLNFEMPSEEELRETRASNRAARAAKSAQGEDDRDAQDEKDDDDDDKSIPGVSKETWKKVKSKKKPKKKVEDEPSEDENDD